MERDFWHKQAIDAPLFPDMLWSRPENKRHAGKLLIAGGNLHGFSAPAEAYGEAMQAGVGVARVLLPDSLQKTVGKMFPGAEFGPSTPSGSFAREALGELLPAAQWADGVLIAGDLGRNSETAILLESFAKKYSGQISLTSDAADYFIANPQEILARPDTLLIVSVAQLQKLATNAKFSKPITFGMDLLHLVETLHEFTVGHKAYVITRHLGQTFIAVNGQVSTTKAASTEEPIWRIKTAAKASVWWLQNGNKPFEALTTSIFDSRR